jgi:hypothetical protein
MKGILGAAGLGLAGASTKTISQEIAARKPDDAAEAAVHAGLQPDEKRDQDMAYTVGRRYVFLDPRVLVDARNVMRRFHPAKKHDGPIMVREREWEKGGMEVGQTSSTTTVGSGCGT